MSITTNNPRLVFRLLALLAAAALAVAACGGDGDDESTGDEDTEETTGSTEAAEETTEETTEESDAEEGAADEGEAEEGDDAAAPADALAVELGEWFITTPAVSAGTVTFALDNTGENPHALAIARGTSYEELPQLDNGAVDTDALGDDYLGTSEDIASGASGTVEFDLEAGDYVFFCPIEFGPNSHAGAGQVLSVTVG